MSPSLLDALWQGGHLRTLDHALAQSLRRLDPTTPDTVLAAAALASLAVAKGHAGLKLEAAPELLDNDAAIAWPVTDDWQRQLAASRWISSPADATQPAATDAPLVFEHGLLYLRRYREYERNLAQGLHRIAAGAAHGRDQTPHVALSPLFAQLFPGSSLLPLAGGDVSVPSPASREKVPPQGADEGALPDDRQAQAAALALHHTLLLVTGGPGTGKTTTVARMLALLAAQARHAGAPAPRIALAAPTGRAAERMADSVRNAVQSLAASGVDATLLAQLPTAGTTLHRLLGTIPDSPRFRHHAADPLPFDIVVVDEASMIDLPLMAKLVDAVADGARLVLLGDPDQLPSVEAGDVLSGILRAASNAAPAGAAHGRDPNPALVGATEVATDLPAESSRLPSLPQQSAQPTRFPARHVHLVRNWRQDQSLRLAPLAAAVRAGDADAALSLLRNGTLSNVHFHESLADPLHTHRDALLAHWRALADAATPAEALARANRLRLLTAVRDGPQGARTLNARIEALLADSRRRGSRHFHGQPLIVTENSYRHRLFNGDIGIVHRDADGTPMAWFPGDDPAHPRAFHPATLPAHDSAFAMTVHKAQGSEFDTVWLLLPARANRVLSRELVYTGLTRARRELHVATSGPILRDALSRHAGRWSGLGWRLQPETVL